MASTPLLAGAASAVGFAVLFGLICARCRGTLTRHTHVHDAVFHAATVVAGAAAVYAHGGDGSFVSSVWLRGAADGAHRAEPWYVATFAAVQCGYYVCALLIVAATTRRRDMMLHHAFAALLSVGASVFAMERLCLLVGAAHGISDVCLLAGKLLIADQRPAWASDACLYAFVATWLYVRVYYITAHLWWPLVVRNAFGLSPATHVCMSAPVGVIVLLQAYWTTRIVRALFRKATQGTTTTDDDDDDDDEE